jgi:hypothetical protein
MHSCRSLWKQKLLACGTGKREKITNKYTDPVVSPIRHGIASAFMNFITCFTKLDNNFKHAYLIDNEALTIGIRSRNCLRRGDITPGDVDNVEDGRDPETVLSDLKNLTMTSLFVNEQPVTKVSFQRDIGAVISQQLWAKLDKIRRAALTRYGNDPIKKSIGIADFLSGYKKGSKKIRKILCGKNHTNIPHNMVKFSEQSKHLTKHGHILI